jgi:hypothetical protein
VVLGGVAAVTAVALRRRRRSDERSPGASTPALAGDDAARLEADLERYDL